jgi:hypothetical protein
LGLALTFGYIAGENATRSATHEVLTPTPRITVILGTLASIPFGGPRPHLFSGAAGRSFRALGLNKRRVAAHADCKNAVD